MRVIPAQHCQKIQRIAGSCLDERLFLHKVEAQIKALKHVGCRAE